MIPSRLKVKELCDQLMQVAPEQITIDLIQEVVEGVVHSENPTPDDIVSASYQCDILIHIYNPIYDGDINYLKSVRDSLDEWNKDAEFANKSLGLDPNK